MPDTIDWKQKYRDSLLEMESDDRRRRHVEEVLRRLVGRLCAAAIGSDPKLDAQLSALAAANRNDADVSELERLAESLHVALVSIDGKRPATRRTQPPNSAAQPASTVAHSTSTVAHSTSAAAHSTSAAAHSTSTAAHSASAAARPAVAAAAVPSSSRCNETCAALALLLDHLKSTAVDASAVQALGVELSGAHTDAAAAAVIERATHLLRDHEESIARERLRAAAVLSEVTKRLEEMSSHLTESHNATRTRFDDTQSLNASMMSHFRELSVEIGGATEIAMLQSAVNARLESVARQLSDFREREAARLAEYNGRAESMHARIFDLERETRELHDRLDVEKHGARIDALTSVANRKSFDERFAQAIHRRAEGGPPSSLLLWDIDNFKPINDSYGHRAGDRVLKGVAGCLASSLRPGDFVARVGGEEFAVLAPGLKLADAVKFANHARLAVEALRFHFRGTPVRVTVSCGVTELHREDGPEAAFDRADAALYRAKSSGKNLCVAA